MIIKDNRLTIFFRKNINKEFQIITEFKNTKNIYKATYKIEQIVPTATHTLYDDDITYNNHEIMFSYISHLEKDLPGVLKYDNEFADYLKQISIYTDLSTLCLQPHYNFIKMNLLSTGIVFTIKLVS